MGWFLKHYYNGQITTFSVKMTNLPTRFYSLDVFRGATVALMILVNNPGSWSHVYAPFRHADWHGCTPTDLVFPFFLFAVGNAMAFVMPRLREAGPAVFWKKITRRFLLIFGIGLLLAWFPFVRYNESGELVMKSLEKLRIPGVLQRIALCYYLASILVYYLKPRSVVLFSAVMLLGYWVLCIAGGAPGDPYSLDGYFGTAIDKAVFGTDHLYRGEGVAFDPEGLMSTIPAIISVIAGYLAGRYIITKGKNWDMLSHLLVAGLLLVCAGYCWHIGFPINKKIWTSSFTLYTSGLACCSLGVLIFLVEFKNKRGAWSSFFDVFGKNPLFIYVLSGVWVRLYGLFRIQDGMKEGKPVFKGLGTWLYDHVFSTAFGNFNGSLAYAICHIVLFWLIGYFLDLKKIYIRV
jgi:predicted acyltransferase